MRETRFLRACRGEAVDTTPVWMMRQAGRYLPEYRALREGRTFMEMCRTPELAVEVTLQPVRRLDVDVAILFSDILVVLDAMGLPVRFESGRGPVIEPSIRDEAAVDALRPVVPEDHLRYVMDAIRILRRELDGVVPLVGFSGAPFTLASYAIEGGGTKSFQHIKAMMFRAPALFDRLMTLLADAVAAYLRAQVAAGVQAVQLFDTWAGVLSASDYAAFVAPHTRRVIAALRETGVPVIHYINGCAHLLSELGTLGADVISVDWRVPLGSVVDALGPDVVVQGNLEPSALYAPVAEIERRVSRILEAGRRARGHVFNLGHGIHPDVEPEQAQAMIEAVHRLGKVK